MKTETCIQCLGQIKPICKAGRMFRDKEIPEYVAIPTCDTCGEEYLSPQDCKVLSKALKSVQLAASA